MKSLLLTFDYELFLGDRSGTVDNCLIVPTEKVLDCLKRRGFTKAIFFIDTVYLMRLRESKVSACRSDLDKITNQLKEIHALGHYIFPHLHPHWLDAEYLPEINQWCLSNPSKYSLANVSPEQRSLLFKDSIKIVEEITGRQPVLGYRAGGWCIQPFEIFRPFFDQYNIRYEFSVMPGCFCNTPYSRFDYRKASNRKYYSFNENVTKPEVGKYIEFPISMVRTGLVNSILNRVFIKFLYKRGIKNFGDGLSSVYHRVSSPPGFVHMASLELLTMMNIGDVYREFEKKKHLHLISHPKMLNPHNITCLGVLLDKLGSRESLDTDFKRMVSDPII
jgi:hypothetical protein